MIEQRFHRTVIGSKGDKIRELRSKFPEVQISFPDPSRKTDCVNLRGPREDVDKVYTHLKMLNAELVSPLDCLDVVCCVCFLQYIVPDIFIRSPLSEQIQGLKV